MARNDDTQSTPSTPSRVYKSSDVHRRTSNFKVIRGSKRPEPAPAPDASAGQEQATSGAQPAAGNVPAAETPVQEKARTRPSRRRSMRDVPGDAGADYAAEGVSAADADASDPDATSEWDDGQTRTQRRQRAADAFSRRRPRFDVEAAPDVPVLTEEDLDDQLEEEGRVRRARRHAASKPKRRVGRVIAIIVTVLLLIVLVVMAAFSWNRWLRYDDTADFQGQWYVEGTSTPVTIDANAIRITQDVAYMYDLDTTGKTLVFSFGKLEGRGRYWFENHRARLVIVDGEGYTAASTFLDDFQRTISGFVVESGGGALRMPEGQDIIVLSRTATAVQATPATPAQPAPAENGENGEGQGAEGQGAEGAQPADGQGAGGETPAAASEGAQPAGAEGAQQPASPAPAADAQAEQPASQPAQGASGSSREVLSVADIVADLPQPADANNG